MVPLAIEWLLEHRAIGASMFWVAVLVGVGGWGYYQHVTAGVWKAKMHTAQEQSKNAINQAKQAQANVELLTKELDASMQAARKAEKAAQDAKLKMNTRVRGAHEKALLDAQVAQERVSELQEKLKGLSGCQQYKTGVEWLVREMDNGVEKSR